MNPFGHQVEQSDSISPPAWQASPLQLESLSRIPSAPEPAAHEPPTLAMGDIWTSLKNTNTDACTTLPIPKALEQNWLDAPLATKFLNGPADDPTFETVARLKFGDLMPTSPFRSVFEAHSLSAHAEYGLSRGKLQENQYISLWANKIDTSLIPSPVDGVTPGNFTHVNNDQSSYTVTDGRISAFKTARGRHDNGVLFSDIKYDANGLVESYSNDGQVYSREGLPDSAGMASWRRTDAETGKFEVYDKRNVVIDTNGIHTYLGEDGRSGTLLSRQLDGSQVVSIPIYKDSPTNRPMGLVTTTTLADDVTKVEQTGYFAPGRRFTHEPTVHVKMYNKYYDYDIRDKRQ